MFLKITFFGPNPTYDGGVRNSVVVESNWKTAFGWCSFRIRRNDWSKGPETWQASINLSLRQPYWIGNLWSGTHHLSFRSDIRNKMNYRGSALSFARYDNVPRKESGIHLGIMIVFLQVVPKPCDPPLLNSSLSEEWHLDMMKPELPSSFWVLAQPYYHWLRMVKAWRTVHVQVSTWMNACGDKFITTWPSIRVMKFIPSSSGKYIDNLMEKLDSDTKTKIDCPCVMITRFHI